MADYQSNKVEIFPNINDIPVAPTSSTGGNISHLYNLYNSLIDLLETDINTLQNTSVTDYSTDITTLQTDVGNLQTSVSSNTNNISTNANGIATNLNSIGTLNTNVSSLQTSINSNIANISSIDKPYCQRVCKEGSSSVMTAMRFFDSLDISQHDITMTFSIQPQADIVIENCFCFRRPEIHYFNGMSSWSMKLHITRDA